MAVHNVENENTNRIMSWSHALTFFFLRTYVFCSQTFIECWCTAGMLMFLVRPTTRPHRTIPHHSAPYCSPPTSMVRYCILSPLCLLRPGVRRSRPQRVITQCSTPSLCFFCSNRAESSSRFEGFRWSRCSKDWTDLPAQACRSTLDCTPWPWAIHWELALRQRLLVRLRAVVKKIDVCSGGGMRGVPWQWLC